MDKARLNEIDSIRRALLKADWWIYVQEPVKKALFDLLDNFDQLAVPFKKAFIETFKFEHARRVCLGKNIRADQPSALFGANMTEECYQSAIPGTRTLLDLDDWVVPNDADVQACMHLCQRIDSLEKTQVFTPPNHQTEIVATEIPKSAGFLSKILSAMYPEKKDEQSQ